MSHRRARRRAQRSDSSVAHMHRHSPVPLVLSLCHRPPPPNQLSQLYPSLCPLVCTPPSLTRRWCASVGDPRCGRSGRGKKTRRIRPSKVAAAIDAADTRPPSTRLQQQNTTLHTAHTRTHIFAANHVERARLSQSGTTSSPTRRRPAQPLPETAGRDHGARTNNSEDMGARADALTGARCAQSTSTLAPDADCVLPCCAANLCPFSLSDGGRGREHDGSSASCRWTAARAVGKNFSRVRGECRQA